MSQERPTKNSSRYSFIIKSFWRLFILGIAVLFIYIFCVSVNFLFLFGDTPGTEKLENPSTELASELYTSDGVLIGKYFTENRSPVSYKKLSPMLVKALVATEDVRFYEHSGIDPQALASIFYYTARGEKRGGSTLTQQLAKNLYKTRREETRGVLGYIPVVSTIIAKTKEWITAIRLENNYTKEEILTMYLNTIEFGSNAYGIKVAAKTFFSTSPDSLKTEEAAMLVGMVNAPTRYSPRFHPKAALEKRNFVIDKLAKYKIISRQEADSLSALPIALKYHVENHVEGPATYFRGAVNEFVKQWCKKENAKAGYEKYDIYTSGLKIYTTIDSRMQRLAEEAVEEKMNDLQKKFDRHWKDKNPWVDEKDKEIPNFIETQIKRTAYYQKLKKLHGNDEARINQLLNEPRPMKVFTWKGDRDTTLVMSAMDSLRYYKRFLHAGMMTMDPFTGQIKAWVGGINFRFFKYDHVKQARRQPGSTFKPFVYLTALENGYAPCDRIRDQRVTINYVENGKPMVWEPNNVTRSFTGINMTLRQAMARSVNSVTAQLTELVGWDKVAQYARRLGITSPLQAVPSIGLGSGGDVSVYDMVGAYATFVNNGFWSEPMFVTRIEDRNGNVIHQFSPKQKRVISEETAFLMVHMLKGGMEEPGGTSQALWEYDLWKNGNQIGGKTGTTSNYSDGWYMGITKDLVSGVWVGGEDRSIHFRSSATGEGSKTALPIYGLFMEKLYKDQDLGYKMGTFPKPAVKIKKNYYCPSPRIPAPVIAIDSIATDLMLDGLNDGSDSIPGGLQ